MSELYFDTEIFKKDTSIFSSLEELNGYHVFSDEFYEKMLLVKEKERAELAEHYQVIFTNETEDTLNEAYMLVMNSEQQIIIRNGLDEIRNESSLGSVAYVAVGMLLTTAVLILLTMMKDMRNKKK